MCQSIEIAIELCCGRLGPCPIGYTRSGMIRTWLGSPGHLLLGHFTLVHRRRLVVGVDHDASVAGGGVHADVAHVREVVLHNARISRAPAATASSRSRRSRCQPGGARRQPAAYAVRPEGWGPRAAGSRGSFAGPPASRSRRISSVNSCACRPCGICGISCFEIPREIPQDFER